MAKAMNSISCAICLDLLKDPVTIPCGHSYCMGCIKGCLDQEDDKGIYNCPQCRQTFISRPALNRKNVFVELGNLKKTTLQAAHPDHYYDGPGDVECDFCSGRKLKAIKFCQMCLASYCNTHLQAHYDSPAFKKHKLVEASTQLQEKICSQHDNLLEVYCRTDQKCICLLCIIDEHKGHDTVSAAAERAEKQKLLGEIHQNLQKIIQEGEKKIQELRQAVDSLKQSSQAAVEESDRICMELIHSIEKKRSEMNELMRVHEKAEVSRAEGLLEQLEQEVAEQRRRDVELKKLSHTEDHIHFLQRFQSLSVSPGLEVLSSIITVNPLISFENVKKSVSEMKNELQDVCKKKMDRISLEIQIECPPEPKTREDFLTYSCQLTLDPNTANQHMCLSEGNRKVAWSNMVQSNDHPGGFTSYRQLWCREGLSGACYWEVEWSGETGVGVAVSYKDISRKEYGNKCGFGNNDQSWRLFCSTYFCCFIHNDNGTVIRLPCSTRVGVYLDHRAGTLSFYSVSNTMTLLHRVQTTFTQPLYPGFNVYDSVKILTPI